MRNWLAAVFAVASVSGAQDFQPGPTAHFSISAQGQFGSDGSALNVSGPVGGSVAVSLSSTSMQGASPIVDFAWTANGMPLPCSGSGCSATLSLAGNAIALTVRDGNGKTSTAMASLNIRAQSGPVARFTMSAQGQFASNGGSIDIPEPPGGSVTVSLSSASSSAGAPIANYTWTANGSPLPCSSSACTAVLSTPSTVITLTVTDSIGQSASASASVRIGGPVAPALRAVPAGPVAHFMMSGPGKSGGDESALSFAVPRNGSVTLSLSSTSRSGGSSITSYSWGVNGIPACGRAFSCSLTLTAHENVITLTATDAEGRSDTASARVTLTFP